MSKFYIIAKKNAKNTYYKEVPSLNCKNKSNICKSMNDKSLTRYRKLTDILLFLEMDIFEQENSKHEIFETYLLEWLEKYEIIYTNTNTDTIIQKQSFSVLQSYHQSYRDTLLNIAKETLADLDLDLDIMFNNLVIKFSNIIKKCLRNNNLCIASLHNGVQFDISFNSNEEIFFGIKPKDDSRIRRLLRETLLIDGMLFLVVRIPILDEDKLNYTYCEIYGFGFQFDEDSGIVVSNIEANELLESYSYDAKSGERINPSIYDVFCDLKDNKIMID